LRFFRVLFHLLSCIDSIALSPDARPSTVKRARYRLKRERCRFERVLASQRAASSSPL
jgi:hypothetical protein